MFWLFNNCDNINFVQIFPYYTKYKDSDAGCINLLYDFTINNDNFLQEYNLKIDNCITIIYDIKIKDSYVQYTNNKNIETRYWSVKNEFIKETDETNIYLLPIFKWEYVTIDEHLMPNIMIKDYDFYYPESIFKIYKINEKKLFIDEEINNIKRKYILELN
jgi:hypothetical protein